MLQLTIWLLGQGQNNPKGKSKIQNIDIRTEKYIQIRWDISTPFPKLKIQNNIYSISRTTWMRQVMIGMISLVVSIVRNII